MPRKKVEKPEVVEEKPEEIMDRTPDGQEEAVLSDSDKNHTEGTEGENSGEEISQTAVENSDADDDFFSSLFVYGRWELG